MYNPNRQPEGFPVVPQSPSQAEPTRILGKESERHLKGMLVNNSFGNIFRSATAFAVLLLAAAGCDKQELPQLVVSCNTVNRNRIYHHNDGRTSQTPRSPVLNLRNLTPHDKEQIEALENGFLYAQSQNSRKEFQTLRDDILAKYGMKASWKGPRDTQNGECPKAADFSFAYFEEGAKE